MGHGTIHNLAAQTNLLRAPLIHLLVHPPGHSTLLWPYSFVALQEGHAAQKVDVNTIGGRRRTK